MRDLETMAGGALDGVPEAHNFKAPEISSGEGKSIVPRMFRDLITEYDENPGSFDLSLNEKGKYRQVGTMLENAGKVLRGDEGSEKLGSVESIAEQLPLPLKNRILQIALRKSEENGPVQ
jgi:hypothetical protein